jgi:hypothetical protein
VGEPVVDEGARQEAFGPGAGSGTARPADHRADLRRRQTYGARRATAHQDVSFVGQAHGPVDLDAEAGRQGGAGCHASYPVASGLSAARADQVPEFGTTSSNRYFGAQAPEAAGPRRYPVLTRPITMAGILFNQLKRGYPDQARSAGCPGRYGAYAMPDYALQCRRAHATAVMTHHHLPPTGTIRRRRARGLLLHRSSPPSERAPRGTATHPSLPLGAPTCVSHQRRDPHRAGMDAARARRSHAMPDANTRHRGVHPHV